MSTKVCTICGQKLDAERDFHKRKLVRSGRRAACKKCTSAQESQARPRRAPSTDPLLPLKRSVRGKTQQAVKAGILTPQPCAVCGSLEVEAHHPVYEGEDAYRNVVWLCREHHVLETMRDPRQMCFDFMTPHRTYSARLLGCAQPAPETGSR